MALLQRLHPALFVCALMLGGCAALTEPVAPCCYSGEYSLARLAEVRLVMSGGRTVTFGEQFPDFAPDPGLFTIPLPFSEVSFSEVVYPRAEAALARFDANGDGLIEEPELTRLMVEEAARGLGLRVEHLQASQRVQALVLPAADVGGLMRWLQRMLPKMTEDGRALFAEIEQIGQDLRLEGSESDDVPDAGNFVD